MAGPLYRGIYARKNDKKPVPPDTSSAEYRGIYTYDLQGGFGPTGLLSLRQRPAAPQNSPALMMPTASGEFDSATGWTLPAGVTIAGGQAVANNAGNVNMQINISPPPITGDDYGVIMRVSDYVSGTVNPTVVFVTAPSNPISKNGIFARTRKVGTNTTAVSRLMFTATSTMKIDYLRVYHMTPLTKKKWRIVFVYSQSNWVGAQCTVDPNIDVAEPRALLVPSRENKIYGSSMAEGDIGNFMPLVDPIQQRTFDSDYTQGGGPAGAFARTFCDGLANDEVLVYVGTGFSGGGRLALDPAVDGTWNRNVNGDAWMNMLNQVDSLLARAPEGSSIAGMLFCQGEADNDIFSGDQHAIAIRGDIEYLRQRWGTNFPVVINEIGYADLSVGNRQVMVDSHKKLDTFSGDKLALPRCTYIPRPADSAFEADNVHYNQATQRTRGALAAEALLDLNYGTVV